MAPDVVPSRFRLVRSEDVSGVSGTGTVAWGCRFPDGTTVIRWLADPYATEVLASFADVLVIHGHDGRSAVDFIDPVT